MKSSFRNDFGPVVCILILGFWIICIGFFNSPRYVDDSFISFRYSLNLAEGYGLTWNRMQAPVEGFSNPLWVFFCSIGMLFGAEIVTFSYWLSIFFLGSTTFLLFWRVGYENSSPAIGLTFASIYLFTPDVLRSNLMGLETSLYAFLVMLFVVFAGRDGCRRFEFFLAILGVLVSLTRFEGGVLVFGLLLFRQIVHRSDDQPLPGRALFVFTLLLLCISCLRWLHFGDLTPLTFQAKGGALSSPLTSDVSDLSLRLFDGVYYILAFCQKYFVLIGLFIFAGVTSFSSSLFSKFVVVASAFFLLVAAANGGDWMPGYRLLTPMLPLLLLVLGSALSKFRYLPKTLHKLSASLLIVLFVFHTWQPSVLYVKSPSFQKHAYFEWDDTGRWLDTILGSESLALLAQIGRIGFYGPNIRIIDFQGLVNPHVAKKGERSSKFGKRLDLHSFGLYPSVIQSNNRSTLVGARSFYRSEGREEEYVELVVPEWKNTFILLKKEVLRSEKFYMPTEESFLNSLSGQLNQ